VRNFRLLGQSTSGLIQVYDLVAPLDPARGATYLSRVGAIARALLTNRDDMRGFPEDPFRGRLMPALAKPVLTRRFAIKLRRTFAALLACVATSAMIMLATAVPARAGGPSPEDALPLVNFGSSKCFEPTPLNGYGDPNAIDANGLLIQQRTCETNLATQYYTFIPLGYVLLNAGEPQWYCPFCITWGTDGYFIQNKSTGLCMDARDGATSDWSVVQQWTCRNKEARSMVWYIEPGDFYGAFKVRNFNSDLCLDVRWGSSDEYAQLQQYHCTSNNASQNFNQPPPV
jgi:hypothetical protein